MVHLFASPDMPYFSFGARAAAYWAVRNYVYESVRHFLRLSAMASIST